MSAAPTTRRATGLVALLLLAVGVVGTLRTYPVGAQTTSTFSLRARADTVGMQLIAKEAPAVSIGGGEVVFLTPSSSQSALDSLGNARSFASAPYPGDLVVSLPSTVSGLLGGTRFPMPGYPLFVSSSFPVDPEASEEVGPYSISARSTQHATDAEAKIGLSTAPPQVVSVTSRTKVARDPATGRAEADALAEIAPLSVSELVRIGDVRATARVVVDADRPDEAAELTSSLSVGTLTIAGIEVGLTDQGLSVGGAPILPVDLSPLGALLTSLGVQLEIIPEARTATSITSAGLRVTWQQVLPSLGETTVRMVLGQVTAAIDPGVGVGDVAPIVPPTVQAAPLPAFAPSAPLELPAAPVTPRVPSAPAAPSTVLVSEMAGADLGVLYPVLAACGALALVTSRGPTALRRLRRKEVQT